MHGEVVYLWWVGTAGCSTEQLTCHHPTPGRCLSTPATPVHNARVSGGTTSVETSPTTLWVACIVALVYLLSLVDRLPTPLGG